MDFRITSTVSYNSGGEVTEVFGVTSMDFCSRLIICCKIQWAALCHTNYVAGDEHLFYADWFEGFLDAASLPPMRGADHRFISCIADSAACHRSLLPQLVQGL